MSMRVAFLHPDLGIGGAERLVVDTALGLQNLGYTVDIYTSHHDRDRCFEETRDGTLNVYNISPPFPRHILGKFHILLAHLRQLHLTWNLIQNQKITYDVFFVDQLSTCVPFLRKLTGTRVVFYCHFPDKLLANGVFIEDPAKRPKPSLLKQVYRYPMDWWEELTTRQSDVILSNSRFSRRVFKASFPSIRTVPRVVYPGINIQAYEAKANLGDADVKLIASSRPTIVSLNRFEQKKNLALAGHAFAKLRQREEVKANTDLERLRLVIAGGYDPRLKDNLQTLSSIIDVIKYYKLTYKIVTPSSSTLFLDNLPVPVTNSTFSGSDDADVVLLLSFSTSQRTYLLSSPSIALLYTPTNEHFGIGPVEGMCAGLPVLAVGEGGPVESLGPTSINADSPLSSPVDCSPDLNNEDKDLRGAVGWLKPADSDIWASALYEIVSLSQKERTQLAERAKERARRTFGMDVMAHGVEGALKEAISKGLCGRIDPEGIMWLILGILGTVLGIVYSGVFFLKD
ncbi:alpha-1,3-mannosyltransferase ALG2 [Dendrothele bispora CBS 962.96]|uniref:Alpha-1,3/1,6-mannosyltransferase ALG2 n=1 Tax=Dendrothele bispora (strain CBS 962.96) TaxID=1314807 RepID=A0A4S8MT79_DENBC|nr:alpha-1,3-mannosyltransferase ALG2 [Dendrothele bispora CBS 962.96]